MTYLTMPTAEISYSALKEIATEMFMAGLQAGAQVRTGDHHLHFSGMSVALAQTVDLKCISGGTFSSIEPQTAAMQSIARNNSNAGHSSDTTKGQLSASEGVIGKHNEHNWWKRAIRKIKKRAKIQQL